MKSLLLSSILLLVSCAPQLVFDKPGVAPGAGQGDLTNCQVEALSKVPPNNQLQTLYGGPATTYAHCTSGYCTSSTYGGQNSVYTVDTNATLRDQYTIQCMAEKGYTLR